MKNEEVKKLSLALGLTRTIVGVKFVFLKEEYDDIELPEFKEKNTFCSMATKGMDGKMLKGDASCFLCQGGPEAFGMVPVTDYIRSGKQFSAFHLYEDAAIARQVQDGIGLIDQKRYGVIVGPLEDMEDADVVLFLADCRQMMRVLQGYAYRFGMPKNIGMVGNQGLCGDLVARPYKYNDLNISLLCYGARLHTRALDGELGCGMPLNKFSDIVCGVLETTNSAQGDPEKRKLLKRLGQPDELGFEIEFGKMYDNYSRYKKYPESLYKQRG